jgi:exosortase E/protease (VPEID-CTERM system)
MLHQAKAWCSSFLCGGLIYALELFYSDITYDASQNQLGVGAFWVDIAPICSGIEGAVLAVSIAAIYLYLSRKYLKFPHALILLPPAGLVSIALNIVRITALIILGAEVSPALAIGGFHSVAGWITAVLVVLLIVFVFSSLRWIQKIPENEDESTTPSADSSLALSILIPFVIFTGATLVGVIFIDKFDYYYPVKVVLTFAAILYFWKIYQFQIPDRKFGAIAVGALVAVVWVLMLPVNEQVNSNISAAFDAMPLWALIGWVTLRLLGFWLLAPILEELVFRGYLLSRLSGQEISTVNKPDFSLFALIVSSLLFGLVHSAWLAGTVAALLFAFVRSRTNSITSCIAAHITANVLVAGWAAYSGNWSLI